MSIKCHHGVRKNVLHPCPQCVSDDETLERQMADWDKRRDAEAFIADHRLASLITEGSARQRAWAIKIATPVFERLDDGTVQASARQRAALEAKANASFWIDNRFRFREVFGTRGVLLSLAPDDHGPMRPRDFLSRVC